MNRTRWMGVVALLAIASAGAAAPSKDSGWPVAQVTEGACEGSMVMDLDIEGFAAGTPGGWQEGFVVYCVTSLADDGPGTLREAMRSGDSPRVVRFAVDGVILLESAISVPSNLTIDGRGADITLFGKGMVIHGATDVIVTNIALEDTFPASQDGIQIGTVGLPSGRVALDHLRFSQTTGQGSSDYVDEAISVVHGSYDVTVQWCRFDHWEKVLLAGNGDAEPDVDRDISLTMHHNVFNQTGRRHPRGRWGQFDVYNNYFYDWHMFTRAGPPGWHLSHGAKCDEGCRMRVENNAFERHWHPQDLFSDANKATMCEKGGQITELGHWISPETSVDLVFGARCRGGDWERPYAATVDPAGPALVELLLQETGNVLQGPV